METKFLTTLIIILIGMGLLIGMFIFLNSCRSQPSLKNWQPLVKDSDSLSDSLVKTSNKFNQPAMAAALIVGEKVIKAAVGNNVYGETQPVNIDSRFHIGSTTKSMTALLIGILVNEGRLRYDMTLEETLPGIKMLEEYRKITIRDLLLNRAGIIAFQQTAQEDPEIVKKLWNEIPLQHPDPNNQRIEVAKIVLNLKPIAIPGTKIIYSNVGWSIAGLIIEIAANRSYEDLLKQKIFSQLGMNTAKIGGWPASKLEPEQPRGHYYNQKTKKPEPQALDDILYIFPHWMNPSGGVHCSITDFAIYAQENLAGLQGKGKLLNREGYNIIHSIQAEADLKTMYKNMNMYGKITLGYGWAVVQEEGNLLSFGDGSGGTFYARIIIFLALNVAFTGFTNCGNGSTALDEVIKQVTGFDWNS